MIKLSLYIVLVWFLLLLNHQTNKAQTHWLCKHCPSTSTFSPDSAYSRNLNTLLSQLATAAGTATNGFGNNTVGGSTSNPVYGVFFCQGDISNYDCSSCVSFAINDRVNRGCQTQKTVIMGYDHCMLHYTSQPIFSKLQLEPLFLFSDYNIPDFSDPTQYANALRNSVSRLIPEAVSGERGKRFAAEHAPFHVMQTLYTLAECTPDLTNADCNECLTKANESLPQGKQVGKVMTPSCNIRFEFIPVYVNSAAAGPDASVDDTPLITPPDLPSPRLAPSVNASNGVGESFRARRKMSTVVITVIVATIATGIVLILIRCCFIWRKTTIEQTLVRQYESEYMSNDESLQFDLTTIQAATNNFTHDNKLGHGGFGVVYKGTLSNGQNVAVKRLSCNSRQGASEFENELAVVAKLQHRNLVRLLGFCLEGEEKLLVYEFVPNKSLDYFLFDPQKKILLDWSTRYKILTGIAKGILYLHEDSRLRIIHRDLKASNVLLDNDMNPKVSDFGMAKIFRMNQVEGNTKRVVGTYGYMAPEYAMYGQFSVKTDVYSFGILLLEIISGRKSKYLHRFDCNEILPSLAWKHWRNGTTTEVIDPQLRDSLERSEVIKCIHIGLLCIQENPTDRPTMAAIVHMLNSQIVSMAVPREPAFFFNSRVKAISMIHSKYSRLSLSVNQVSITELYPR